MSQDSAAPPRTAKISIAKLCGKRVLWYINSPDSLKLLNKSKNGCLDSIEPTEKSGEK